MDTLRLSRRKEGSDSGGSEGVLACDLGGFGTLPAEVDRQPAGLPRLQRMPGLAGASLERLLGRSAGPRASLHRKKTFPENRCSLEGRFGNSIRSHTLLRRGGSFCGTRPGGSGRRSHHASEPMAPLSSLSPCGREKRGTSRLRRESGSSAESLANRIRKKRSSGRLKGSDPFNLPFLRYKRAALPPKSRSQVSL